MATSIVLEKVLSTAHGSQVHSAQLTRKRVYILPTREGFILSAVLLTMLVGAINYNNNMAYILTFLLGSVFMTGILHTYRNLAGLIITGTTPRPVFAGETAVFPLVINNHEGQARHTINLICKPKRDKKSKAGIEQYIPVTTDIPANRKQKTEIRKVAHKRGALALERVVISTKYPLGLFRAWSYIDIDLACTIYPKPEGDIRLPLPLVANEQGQAGTKTGTDDFAGFRHYHPGDSVRNIAWKELAREQPLLVKRFSGEGNRLLKLTWNDVAHLPGPESRLSQLCLWILRADEDGYRYGLEIPQLHIKPDQGNLHRNRCLEALAYFGLSR